jgi:hypothetical protein
MPTPVSDVVDLFMARVSDYRLNNLFLTSGSVNFNIYIEPWLMDSAVDFSVCSQDLTYVQTSGSTEGYFTETLTSENKLILSRIMLKFWLAQSVNNILKMDNVLQDHDYKVHSAAQNLKAKMDLYNNYKEELSQTLQDYSYKKNDWSDWYTQSFDSS